MSECISCEEIKQQELQQSKNKAIDAAKKKGKELNQEVMAVGIRNVGGKAKYCFRTIAEADQLERVEYISVD